MHLSDIPVVYWDTNVFIAFMKKEELRLSDIEFIINETECKKLVIVTSPFTFTEAWKANGKECHQYFDDVRKFFKHDCRQIVSMNSYIGVQTQKLQNEYPLDWKDSIHIATALVKEVDVLLTYDGVDPKHENSILKLDNVIPYPNLEDKKLSIKTPEFFVKFLKEEKNRKEEEKELRKQENYKLRKKQKDISIGQDHLFENGETEETNP